MSVIKKRERPPTTNGSILRSFQILKCFSYERPRLRLKEIGELTGLSPATAHRFLNTMKEVRLIEQQQGAYALGRAFLDLAGIVLYSMEVRQRSLPYVEELAAKTRAAANLAILDGSEILHIARAESPETPWGYYFHIGIRRPAFCTALGKALLSGLSDSEVSEIFRQGVHRYTASTVVDAGKLLEELKQIRLQGYAFDFEGWQNGLNCLAAPIRDSTGAVAAAIGISGPTSLLPAARVEECVPVVLEVANRLSGNLGFAQGML